MMKKLMIFTFLLTPLTVMAQTSGALQPGAVYIATPAAEDDTGRVLLFIPQADGSVGGPILSAEGEILCNARWSAKAKSGTTGLQFTEIRLTDDPCATGLEHIVGQLGLVRSEAASEGGISLLDTTGEELFRLAIGG